VELVLSVIKQVLQVLHLLKTNQVVLQVIQNVPLKSKRETQSAKLDIISMLALVISVLPQNIVEEDILQETVLLE